LLLVPALAAPYYGRATSAGWPEWAINTPVHLLWAGTEAVFLFFVLSGLVLGLSTRSRSFTWESYFPARLVRLYLPVIAAVLLAWITILAFPRNPVDGASAWLEHRPAGYTPGTALLDMILVGGVSATVSPLWSLQWEVLFSLLLPVYVVLGRRIDPWVLGVGSVALSVAGATFGVKSLMYLPMFGIGIALAEAWNRIGGVIARRSTAKWHVAWGAMVVLAALAVVGYWFLVLVMPANIARPVSVPIALAGISIIVIAAGWWSPLRGLLSTRLLQWFGLVSFSLYLVHEPIVIAAAHATGSAAWGIVVAVPTAFLVAWLFHLAVERPAHRLARRIKGGTRRDPVDLEAERVVT
jgi:peptidoglycan/LPS O-acetylase OafA/YrhL